jgi:hypothetical protein
VVQAGQAKVEDQLVEILYFQQPLQMVAVAVVAQA